MAFRVADKHRSATLDYLRERELISAAYLEARLDVSLSNGTVIESVTYIVDRDHDQYCAGLELEDQAQIIAAAHGGRGPNSEYLHSTAEQLESLGIGDKDLNWLSRRVIAISPSG